MFKKIVTYIDFNGVERTDEIYFNVSKSELKDIELGSGGGFSRRLQRISETKDPAEVIQTFKEILKLAYGVKSDDGMRFVKNDQVWEDFTQTAVYDHFFNELLTDANAAADFANAILPKDLMEAVQKEQKGTYLPTPEQTYQPSAREQFENRTQNPRSGVDEIANANNIIMNPDPFNQSPQPVSPDQEALFQQWQAERGMNQQ